MELAGDYMFDAPQALVWEALQDPKVLGSVMPGGSEFEQVGENEYAGSLKVKVGPVQGDFKGQIKLFDINEPESYQMEVDGKGAAGFVNANGNMRLEARGDNQTYMEYSGSAQVGGRIASVGQRLVNSSARSIIRQSLEGLNAYLRSQVAEQASPDAAASGEGQDVTDYRPPTQARVAWTVARDVAGDIVPAKYIPALIAGAIVIIGIIVLLLLSP